MEGEKHILLNRRHVTLTRWCDLGVGGGEAKDPSEGGEDELRHGRPSTERRAWHISFVVKAHWFIEHPQVLDAEETVSVKTGSFPAFVGLRI